MIPIKLDAQKKYDDELFEAVKLGTGMIGFSDEFGYDIFRIVVNRICGWCFTWCKDPYPKSPAERAVEILEKAAADEKRGDEWKDT